MHVTNYNKSMKWNRTENLYSFLYKGYPTFDPTTGEPCAEARSPACC